MTEKAEASALLSNIFRTLPYTAYLATLSHGIIFAHEPSYHLFAALILNEVLGQNLICTLDANSMPCSYVDVISVSTVFSPC